MPAKKIKWFILSVKKISIPGSLPTFLWCQVILSHLFKPLAPTKTPKLNQNQCVKKKYRILSFFQPTKHEQNRTRQIDLKKNVVHILSLFHSTKCGQKKFICKMRVFQPTDCRQTSETREGKALKKCLYRYC
jgi:hypothetical protein